MRRLLLLALLLALANASASSPIRILVRPKIAQAPSDVHLKVFVDRDPLNRAVDWAIDGENFFRSSGQTLEGDSAAAVFDIWYQHVPCGAYVVAVRVTRADGSHFDARDQFRLLGMGCEDPQP
jgi:hypothetical protein